MPAPMSTTGPLIVAVLLRSGLALLLWVAAVATGPFGIIVAIFALMATCSAALAVLCLLAALLH